VQCATGFNDSLSAHPRPEDIVIRHVVARHRHETPADADADEDIEFALLAWLKSTPDYVTAFTKIFP
jgi:hypothetical protein